MSELRRVKEEVQGKKLVMLVTLAALILSLGSAAWAVPFQDISGHWAEKNIVKMYAKGAVSGYGEEYKPNESISKEQAVVMLIRVMGLADQAEGKAIPVTFRNPDAVSSYAQPSVALAVSRGIISGGDLIDFRPQDPAKRYEIAVLIARVMGFEASAGNFSGSLPFTDSQELNDRAAWAAPYVYYVHQQGIMSGDADGTFRPLEPVTRAEMAALLARVDTKLNKLSSNSIKGEAYSISPASNSLLLQDAGMNIITIPVVEGIAVYKNDKNTALGDLNKGEKLMVIRDSQNRAVYIEVIPEAQFAYDEVSVVGTVETVQKGTPLVVAVRTGTGVNSYSLGADAEVEVDGQEASVNDIVPGQEVTMIVQGASVLKITAQNSARELTGEITGVTRGTAVTITFKEEKGGELTYTLGSLAKVYLDYKEADPDVLLVGQQATIDARGKEISRIWASSVKKDVEGTLSGVAFAPQESITIKVKDEEGVWETFTYEVDQDAKIRRDRKSVSLRDLVAGDAVEIELINNVVTDIYAEKVELETEGRITTVTLAFNPSITIVDEEGDEITFKLASGASIRKDRSRITVNDLKIGDYVYIEVEGETIVKMDVEDRIVKNYVVGSIENINEKAEVLVINPEGDQYEQSIFIESDTFLIKFNKEIRFRDLEAGDKIIAIGEVESGLLMAETVIVIGATD